MFKTNKTKFGSSRKEWKINAEDLRPWDNVSQTLDSFFLTLETQILRKAQEKCLGEINDLTSFAQS